MLLKDAAVANAELHQLIGGAGERFFPVYTLNPTFPDAAEQLERCRQEYGLAPGRGRCDCIPASSATRSTTPASPPCLRTSAPGPAGAC